MFRKLFSYRRSCSHKHCTPSERLCHSVRPAHESSFLFWNGKDKQKSALLQQKHCNRARRQQFACRFLHPDYTVGPGIAPGQHPQKVVADLEISLIALARRLNIFSFGTLWQRKQLPYRQWGITPRPETNFLAQSIACRPRLVKRKLFDLYIFYQSIPFLFSSQPCSGGCDMIS